MMKISQSFFAVIFSLNFPILFAQSLSTSLTACYALNGTGSELINALTATLNVTQATLNRNNLANAAIAFAGNATSYAELPDNPLLKSNNVSFSGWVKINAFQSDDHIVFTRNQASASFAAYSLITYNSGGKYRFRTYKENGSVSLFAQSTTTLILNTWYHVVCTIDNTALKIYVNGSLENTTASTINFDYVPGKTVVLGGCNETIYNTPLNGALDNFRFYNRILTPAEVLQLYNLDPACVPETVGLEKRNANFASYIFPNPSSGIYTLRSAAGENYEVINIEGKVVMAGITGQQTEIDLRNESSGIYFLKISNEQEKKSIKLIRE